jgi:hypothetical protein
MDKAIPHFQPLYNPTDRRDRGGNKNFTPGETRPTCDIPHPENDLPIKM